MYLYSWKNFKLIIKYNKKKDKLVSSWCSLNGSEGLKKVGAEGIGNYRKNQDHPDNIISKIGQNT